MMAIRLAHMPGQEPVKAKRGNKFGAVRTACGGGHVHASKREAAHCDGFRLLERAGQIRNLEQQPRFVFTMPDGRQVTDEGRPVRYTADFRFDELRKDATGASGWHSVVIDVKGRYRDDTWRLRRAFFRFFHPDVELREVP